MKKYKLNKGVLIAIEGVDGAGKTTQTKRLCDHFKRYGLEVATFKEPTNGKYGQKIRNLAIHGRDKITPEKELELFIKDRIENCQRNLKPALEQKKLVFVDRYYFSSIAYQGALGLDINYIQKRNEEIAIVPNLVIILDVAVKIGLDRIKYSRKESHNHFEKEEYLEKVRDIFLKLKDPYIEKIDGSQEENRVFNDMKKIIQIKLTPYLSIVGNGSELLTKELEKDSLAFVSN